MIKDNEIFVDALNALATGHSAADDKFRAKAFRKAAEEIAKLDIPVSEVANVQSIAGVGKGIAEILAGIIATGSCDRLEVVKEESKGKQELQRLEGVGPKTAEQYIKLGIGNLEQLRIVIETGSDVLSLKDRERLAIAMVKVDQSDERVPCCVMVNAIMPFLVEIRKWPEVNQADIAGSTRRSKETVGDLDVVVETADSPAVIQRLTGLFGKVSGEKKLTTSINAWNGSRQLDILLVEPGSYGAAMNHFTGSKEWNIDVRAAAKSKGLLVNQYGIFDGDTKLGGEDEDDLFELLGIPWVPPEQRESGAFSRIASDFERFFDMVEFEDVQGDLHVHTIESDGMHTLPQVVVMAEALGFKYVGISDHSKSLGVAGGLSEERLLRQIKEIRGINEDCAINVLAGSEMDVLPDGTFDWSEKVLSELDYVIAAMHIQPGVNLEHRMKCAMRHPKVVAIAHPTGRMFGTRTAAIGVDWRSVFKMASDTNTAMEINGQPLRQDLPSDLIQLARSFGVKFSLTSDMHRSFDALPLAVRLARRGGVRKNELLDLSVFDSQYQERKAANRRISP